MAQCDSCKIYADRNDYKSLKLFLDKNSVDDPLTSYYKALTFRLDGLPNALIKIDSLIEVEYEQITLERLTALKFTYYRQSNNYNEVIESGPVAYRTLTDQAARFSLARAIAISFRKLDQYESAMNWSLKMESLANESGDLHAIHKSLQNKANLFASLNEYERSLEIEKKLIPIADKMQNRELQVLDRLNLGGSYHELDNYDAAFQLYQESLKMAQTFNIQDRIPLILYNIGSLHDRWGNDEKALETLLSSYHLAKKQQNQIVISAGNHTIANSYLKVGQYENASLFLTDGLKLADSLGLKKDVVHLLKLKAELEKRRDNPWKALDFMVTADSLENELLNNERIRTIEEMQAKYDYEKQQSQIERLEQEALITNLKSRERNVLFITTISILILVVVLGTSLYRNRILRSNRTKSELEYRLLRTQMNPHFLFNALTSIHGFVFKGDKKEAAEYLSTFSTLTRDILNYSSLDFISLEEEVSFLKKYLEIQSLRFPEVSHQIDIQIINESIDIKVPSMILQPFIENCYEHGFRGREMGHIDIHIFEKNNMLSIEIKDNGKGLSKSHTEVILPYQSKGIKITRDRLEMIYKNRKSKAFLSIDNIIANNSVTGTEVKIQLPISL